MPPSIARPIGKDAQTLVRQLKARSSGVKDRVLNEIGREMKADFEQIVEQWEHKPHFDIIRTPETVSVVTKDKIFGYVNAGTRAHVIRPKQGRGRLTFKTGYKARTRPNNPSYIGPGLATGPFRSAKSVKHPGSKARNFTRIIANVWRKEGLKLMRAEIRKQK